MMISISYKKLTFSSLPPDHNSNSTKKHKQYPMVSQIGNYVQLGQISLFKALECCYFVLREIQGNGASKLNKGLFGVDTAFVVMGPSLSSARARLGARVFQWARGSTSWEEPKLGLGSGSGSKARQALKSFSLSLSIAQKSIFLGKSINFQIKFILK